jgi:hypothetical protein
MAGSVSINYSEHETVKYVEWVWTSDGSGDVSGTDTKVLSGQASRYATDPSATAPSANYDITILDSFGIDITDGVLGNRHTSNSEQVLTGGDAKDGAAFMGVLSLVVANAGDSKIGTLRMYYR